MSNQRPTKRETALKRDLAITTASLGEYQARVDRLRHALRDCISTYDPSRTQTFVGAERQEAWIDALNS